MFGAVSFSYTNQNLEKWKSESSNNSKFKHNYYLDIHIEESRRVFSLFHSVNNGMQDLLSEKSFDVEEMTFSQKWLQKLIKKYQLKIEVNKDSLEPHLYPINQTSREGVDSDEVLWLATNEWSSDWEVEYGKWANQNLNAQFMIDLNLPTDCADVAYTLRWIFAYIHKLPMANRLGGSRPLFTNETVLKEWLKYPQDPDWKKDKRFKEALKYILRNTYTHTLMSESYPIAINANKLTSGAYHLALFSTTGHTMLVHKVNEPNLLPITLLYSTVPAKVRELIPSFYQETQTPVLYTNGFYKIRWSKKTNEAWDIIPAEAIPDYSEEQFHLDSESGASKAHFINVFKRLNPDFSFEKIIENSLGELNDRLRDRIQVVEQGFQYCQQNDCSPGSVGDEDWSTPSRDARLRQLNDSMNTSFNLLFSLNPESYEKWIKLMAEQSKVKVFTIANKLYSLDQVMVAVLYQLSQADPRLSIEQRWGLSPQSGYGFSLMDSMKTILPQRKALIEKSEECRQLESCREQIDFIKNNHSFLLDKKILTLWSGANLICQMSGEIDCQELRDVLSAQNFEGHSYLEWFEKTPLWVSNPTSNPDLRWGNQGTSVSTSSPFIGVKAFFTYDRQWFSYNQNLYQSSDNTKIEFPLNEKLGQLHYYQNKYFTYEKSNNSIIIRIYQTPRQLLSTFTVDHLSEPFQARIWWSSPNKETLSTFIDKDFYEVDLQGAAIQKISYQKFDYSQLDPRLSFIETATGVYMSDAEKDASHFVKIPFKMNQIFDLNLVTKTNSGWLFQRRGKVFYLENSEFFKELSFPNKTDAFMSKNLNLLIVEEAQLHQAHIYQLQKKQDGSGDFSFLKTIKGDQFSLVGNFLKIKNRESVGVYDLKTLAPLNLKCKDASQTPALLSEEIYICNGVNYSELYQISGNPIPNSKRAGKSAAPGILTQGNQSWVTSYQRYYPSTDNQRFNPEYILQEFFPLTNEGLEEAEFQSHYSYLVEDYFGYDSQVKIFDRFGVAPESMSKYKSTNFGHLQMLPLIRSRILSDENDVQMIQYILFKSNESVSRH